MAEIALNGVVVDAHPLFRAVEISLFTWARADPSDAVDGEERWGWWGDSFPTVAGDRIGSRLWLLQRQVITPGTMADAERYAADALAWMVDDQLVDAVDVQCLRTGVTSVALRVVLDVSEGQLVIQFDDVMGRISGV